jgi:hypothetical protein
VRKFNTSIGVWFSLHSYFDFKKERKMACKNVCKLCDKLIISTAVNFDAATNEVIVGLPDACYKNNCKYCLVIAQPIPTSATINALVTVAIGTDPTRYPLVDCGCAQVTACNINTRTKYSTIVNTNTVSGVFKLLSNIGCCGRTNLASLPVSTTAEEVQDA